MTALTAAHLFKFELALLLLFAALLLLAPSLTARTFGWPAPEHGFWPRLSGALLLGIAVAAIATDQGWLTLSTAKGPLSTGIGLGAFVAINLTVAFVLASMLIFGAPIPTRRGKALLWLLIATLTLLGFVAIAYVR